MQRDTHGDTSAATNDSGSERDVYDGQHVGDYPAIAGVLVLNH
jgi:hypothetical protein